MTPQQPSNPITAVSEYSNKAEVQEKVFKTSEMKMIEVLKEETNKPHE